VSSFYKTPILFQKTVAILLLVCGVGFLVLWIYTITKNPFFFFLFIFLGSVYHFTTTPFLKLKGTYKYYSPMFLVFMPSDEKYDVHSGTSFDYLFVMWGNPTRKPFRNKLLSYYLEGLLRIIDEIELEAIPKSVLVRGSSYFFGERTAKNFGFEIKETGQEEKYNFIFLYFDLTWMYSLSQGKLTFPKLKEIKTAEISGEKLCEQKEKLLRMYNYLNRGN
jgi:hypothetical protein